MRTETIANTSAATAGARGHAAHRRTACAVAATLGLSIAASLALLAIAHGELAPSVRPVLLSGVCWTLVAGGIAGTYLAGAGMRCGWLVLLGMQPIWIAYAIVTGQVGFVLGSVAYAGGQLNGYMRASSRAETG
jgi:hypothetical protein